MFRLSNRKNIFSEKIVIENFTKEKSKSLKEFRIFRFCFFHFSKNIFSTEKKKLRKISIHYIDVKFSEESIFRIFKAI